jgi:hypothetical protein
MKNRDYLKYFKIVRKFIQSKYKLNLQDLEILLYLSSEGYFSKQVFSDYKQVFAWEKNRIERLTEEGWINVFREKTKKRKALYTLSYKAKKMIDQFYRILEGEAITENPNYNPIFKDESPFNERICRSMIKKRNKLIKQQRHPFRK